jgi:hypothetical protein
MFKTLLATGCLMLLCLEGLPWVAVAIVSTAALLAAVSFAVSPLIRLLDRE